MQRLLDLVGDSAGHVGVDADQFRRRLNGHLLGHGVTPIAALRDKPVVAEPLHENGPGTRDARGVPAEFRRLSRKAVAGKRGDHDVEGIRLGAAMRGRVGQRIDELQLLDDGPRPTVGDDNRHGVFVLRADMDEMNVDAVDGRHKLRQGIQPGFDPAPIIVGRPILGELLHGRQLHSLRDVVHQFPARPLGRGNAAFEVRQFAVGSMKLERANGGVGWTRRLACRGTVRLRNNSVRGRGVGVCRDRQTSRHEQRGGGNQTFCTGHIQSSFFK